MSIQFDSYNCKSKCENNKNPENVCCQYCTILNCKNKCKKKPTKCGNSNGVLNY